MLTFPQSVQTSLTMPITIIRSSRAADQPSQSRGPTFTGQVWADPVISNAAEGITINNVIFTPCARTHWHHHEDGQVLQVTVGSGWVCEKGGKPQKINVGDIIWSPAGTTHWHGADEGSLMSHLAVSLGKTTWFEAVTEEEYAQKNEAQ